MAYFDNCLPIIASAPDSSGTSLTRYGTHVLTYDEFVADGTSENLRRIYSNLTNIIMRGYQPNTLDMLLFGRLRDYSMHLEKKKVKFQSFIQPFVTFPKEDVVNTGSFVLVNGNADGVAEDFQWKIAVQNGPAAFQDQTLPALSSQFIAGDTVLIFFTHSDGSNLVRHLEVVSAAETDVGDTPQADVIVQAPYNQAQWDALTEAEQATYQPTGGVLFFAGNSTSNYRSRCNQKGLYNSKSLIQFWFQTQRKMFQWTDEYEKINNAETMSEFFKAFERIPLAEQIKILDADFMREIANNLFWSQPYAGQNEATWQDAGELPVVYDLDGVTVMDVETRMKGIETQLDECGRVLDFAGTALNMDELGPMLQQVARNRAGTGASRDAVLEMDVLVGTRTAANLKKVIAAVYRDGYNIQYQQQVGQGQRELFSQTKGVWANSYDLDDFNLRLNVISGYWLDDLLAQTPVGHQNATSYAMFLDFTDIDWFVMEQKNRNVEWPPRNIPIDATKCLIDFNVRTIRMESMTHGVAVKKPSRHLIAKGFNSSTCPRYTASACSSYEG